MYLTLTDTREMQVYRTDLLWENAKPEKKAETITCVCYNIYIGIRIENEMYCAVVLRFKKTKKSVIDRRKTSVPIKHIA